MGSGTGAGQPKELGLYPVLASVQKVELLDTCPARHFSLNNWLLTWAGLTLLHERLQTRLTGTTKKKRKKITTVITTSLDFAAKIRAATTFRKEEKLRPCRKTPSQAPPPSDCRESTWAQRPGIAGAQRHVRVQVASCLTSTPCGQAFSCPCVPVWSTTVLLSLKFLVENILPCHCP